LHGIVGHRRLSIIELSESANQPFHLAEEPNCSIVYNGEIYNYLELQKEFIPRQTNSDTEVIMRGYLKEGVSYFKRLRGIYAFAVVDYRHDPKVILCRDPGGVKPLYYYSKAGNFLFASEIKAILPLLNSRPRAHEGVIKAYLSVGYCPEPFTAYQDLLALEPGRVLTLNLTDFSVSQEDNLVYRFEGQAAQGESDLGAEVLGLLKRSVQRNVVSDVPVFFSLSGGIDSSLLVALAKELGLDPATITVTFNDSEYNEEDVARVYSETLSLNARFITCDAEGSLDLLNRLLVHFDQPFADSSLIPFYFLAREAGRLGKVLIGGDGGDEIHAGYANFRILPRIRTVRFLAPLLARSGEMVNGALGRMTSKTAQLMATSSDEELMYLRDSWVYPKRTLNCQLPFLFDYREGLELYSSCFPYKGDIFSERLLQDVFRRRMLGDYLRKADMMSMLNSVEYRVPMLDEDLVGYSLGIPLSQKLGRGPGKKILRSLHRKYYPASTSKRRKSGFSIPLDKWLPRAAFDSMRHVLKGDGILSKYVNHRYVDELFAALDEPMSRRREISRAGIYQQILILYSLQLWALGESCG
jgi:asparagine synthase (glutamine-hydrolysing)